MKQILQSENMEEIKREYEEVHNLRKNLYDFRLDSERQRKRALLVWYSVKYFSTPLIAVIILIVNSILPKSLSSEYVCDLSKTLTSQRNALTDLLHHQYMCTNDSTPFTVGIITAFNVFIFLYLLVLFRGAIWLWRTGIRKFPKVINKKGRGNSLESNETYIRGASCLSCIFSDKDTDNTGADGDNDDEILVNESDDEEANFFDDSITPARGRCDVAFLLHLFHRNSPRQAHLMLLYMSRNLKKLIDDCVFDTGEVKYDDVTKTHVCLKWDGPTRGTYTDFLIEWIPKHGMLELPEDTRQKHRRINGLEPGTEYTFYVYTTRDDPKGNTKRSNSQKIKITTVPNAPSKLGIVQRESEQLAVGWIPGGGDFSESRLTCIRPSEENIRPIPIPRSQQEETFVLPNLDPGTPYRIKFENLRDYQSTSADEKPRNVGGAELLSESLELKVFTVPGKVSELREVKEQSGSDSLCVTWTPPRGKVDQYLVQCHDPAGAVSQYSCPGDLTAMRCANLTPGELYTVAVFPQVCKQDETLHHGEEYECIDEAVYEDGYLRHKDPVTFRVATKPMKVRNIRIHNADTSSMRMTWDKPISGLADEYEVRWMAYRSQESAEPRHTVITDLGHLIKELAPGTIYSLEVRAISHGSESDPEVVIQATKPAPISEADLVLSKMGCHEIGMEWKTPPGGIEGYTMEYAQCVPNSESTLSDKREVVYEAHAHLRSLVPGFRYRIRIRSFCHGLFSEHVEVYYATQPQSPDPLKVKCGTECINVSLTKPEGHVDKFQLQIDGDRDVYEVPIKELQIKVSGKTPGQKYHLRVWSESNGVTSDVIQTDCYTVPDKVCDLSENGAHTDILVASWATPERGNVDSYLAKLFCSTKRGLQLLFERVVETESMTFDKLDPGFKYLLEVKVNANDVFSEPAVLEYVTVPLRPEEILTCLRTPHSLTIGWNVPENSRVEGYEVTICPEKQEGDAADVFYPKRNNCLVENRLSGMLYRLNIRSVSYGVKSQALTCKIQTAPDIPFDVTTKTTTTNILLNWIQNGALPEYYNVTYQSSDGQIKHMKQEALPGQQEAGEDKSIMQSCEILDLSPGTVYSGTITAVDTRHDMVRSEEYSWRVCTVPDTPRNVIIRTSSSMAHLAWTKSSGKLDTYVVRYWPHNDNRPYTSGHARDDVDQDPNASPDDKLNEDVTEKQTATPDINLGELNPGTKYNVKIFALSNEISGASLNSEFINEPLPPEKIEVEATENKFGVSLSHTRGRVDHYTIFVEKGESRFNYHTSDDYLTIPDRIPGKSYEVDIWSESHGIKSQVIQQTWMTPPSKPRDAQIIAKYTDKLMCKWLEPESGFVERYIATLHKIERARRILITTMETKECGIECGDLIEPGTRYEVDLFTESNSKRSEPVTLSYDSLPMEPEGPVSCTRTSTTLHLKWSPPDKGGVEFYRISYYPADQKAQQPQILTTKDKRPNCLLSQLQAGTMYCVDVVSVCHGEESTPLHSKHETVPAVPHDVEMTSGTDVIELSWLQHGVKSDLFIITYSSLNARPTRKEIRGATYADITELTPGTSYSGTLTAVSNQNKELLSDQYQWNLCTKPDKPGTIKMKPSETKAHITWTKSNGNVDMYVIEYWTKDASGERDYCMNGQRETPTAEIVLTDLIPGVAYHFTVQALSNKTPGEKQFGAFTTVPWTPDDVKVVSHTHDMLGFSWCQTKGLADFYEVRVGDEKPGREETTLYTRKDLSPGTEYTFYVRAVSNDVTTENGQHKSAWRKQKVWTDLRQPSNFKQNKAVQRMSTKSLELEWDEYRDTGDEFRITYQCKGGAIKTETVPKSEFRCIIDALTPGVVYECTIQAFLKSGPNSEPCMCKAITVPSQPGNFYDVEALKDKVIVSWGPSEGHVDFYEICCKDSEKKQYLETRPVEASQNVGYTYAGGLEPGRRYQLKVIGVVRDETDLTQNCLRSKAQVLKFSTKPDSPTELKGESIETDGVAICNLEWKAPSLGYLEYYEVCYGEQGGLQQTQRTKDAQKTQCEIGGLKPGVPYSFEVVAVANDMRSAAAHLAQQTDLAKVTDLKVVKTDTQKLCLSWRSTHSKSSKMNKYQIKYTKLQSSTSEHTEAASTPHEVKGLDPGTLYTFEVAYIGWINAQSCISKPAEISAATLPRKPRNVGSTPASTSITLTWDHPEGVVEGYKMETLVRAATWGWSNLCSPVTFLKSTESCQTYKVNDLSPAQEYRFEVFSVSNEKYSTEAAVIETHTAPGKPDNLSAEPQKDGKVEIKFRKTDVTGAKVDSFKLRYFPSRDTKSVKTENAFPGRGWSDHVTQTLYYLREGETYTLEVRCVYKGMLGDPEVKQFTTKSKKSKKTPPRDEHISPKGGPTEKKPPMSHPPADQSPHLGPGPRDAKDSGTPARGEKTSPPGVNTDRKQLTSHPPADQSPHLGLGPRDTKDSEHQLEGITAHAEHAAQQTSHPPTDISPNRGHSHSASAEPFKILPDPGSPEPGSSANLGAMQTDGSSARDDNQNSADNYMM